MKGLFAIALLFICLVSCNNTGKPVDFDYGHVENGIYSNTYFDVSINLPQNWVVQSQEQTDKMVEQGSDLIAGEDENMKTVLKASEVNVANLLSAFQYEYGSAVDYNPSIVINSENIKNFPGIKNGADYLFQAKKLLEQGQFQYAPCCQRHPMQCPVFAVSRDPYSACYHKHGCSKKTSCHLRCALPY